MTETEKRAISELQEATGLVGGAFAVVQGDDVCLECFGFADREAGRPVTEQSIFDIASNSKAFTSMLGAIGTDEGRFDWDAPVRTYFPEFALFDEYAAAHMTGRDLGCHRSGLARHEFMRARVYTSIEDMALRTRFMAFSRGFRENYEYNNHMFIVLGHVLARAMGRPWDALVRERIAGPLDMRMSFRGEPCDPALDWALPYRADGKGGAFRIERPDNPVAGPCGGVRTNLEGMVKWLRCLLGSGAPLCAREAFDELLKTNVPTAEEGNTEIRNGYALGWRTGAYRGRRLVWHGGAIGGFNSNVSFFPEEGAGIAILLNTSGTWGATMLRDVLLDELCGAGQGNIASELAAWRKAAAKGAEPLDRARKGRMPTDAELRVFGGRFFHPAYDDFTVSRRSGDVWLDYGRFLARVRVMPDGSALACEDDPQPDWMELYETENGLAVATSDLAMRLPFLRID
ncbi:MAG TPA: serine hydrolase domain-containing protein [Clostridia bacterium]|nr:serine hydrolase domain-containing protein [Clostridia bacterium]